jgi:hypothetical protein
MWAARSVVGDGQGSRDVPAGRGIEEDSDGAADSLRQTGCAAAGLTETARGLNVGNRKRRSPGIWIGTRPLPHLGTTGKTNADG